MSPTNFGRILYTLLTILAPLSLWYPPFWGRRTLFCTAITILLILAQLFPPFPDTNRRFSLAMLWYLYLSTLEKLLFASPSPEAVYWRLNHPKSEALNMNGFGWEKLKWAVALSLNMRGIGWNFLIKGVPPLVNPKETRKQFVWRQSKGLMVGFLCLDACSFYLRAHHFPPGSEMRARDLGWLERIPIILAMGMQSYFANNFQFQWLSIFAVGVGLSEPKVGLFFPDCWGFVVLGLTVNP